LGGRARHPRNRHVTLNISMLLFGEPGVSFSETELAYEDTIDQHGPDELSMLCRALAEHLPKLKLDAVLALLRTTGWDSDYVVRCVPFLMEALPTAGERLRQELLHGIQLAWAHYYPIGEPDDLPFGLGVLLHALEHYPEALEFFERSLQQFGEDPRTTLNVALTLYRLQRLPETVQWLDRTLALDPANEYARSMRPSVAAELAAAD
jgi:tetratricopeptide (TPR) repeat protein